MIISSRSITNVIDTNANNNDKIVWSLSRDDIQLDSTILEPQYLSGKKKLTTQEATDIWNKALNQRKHLLVTNPNNYNNDNDNNDNNNTNNDNNNDNNSINLGDGGNFQYELNTAISCVQLSSYVSRSVQRNLLGNKGSISKDDNSPVTICDYAVQAIIIDAISRRFPNDRFIAEEDSKDLKCNEHIRMWVKDILRKATGYEWSDDKLYDVIDKGSYDGNNNDNNGNRIWVLDPIDGTKGFMRGEHYCIALALLVDGKPTLSVMGCPNLQLDQVLKGVGNKDINKIAPGYDTNNYIKGTNVHLFPPISGSIFFAVTGHGSFARSLAMPLGAAYEVFVSDTNITSECILCEAAEALHGDRTVTMKVSSSLGLKKDFVRLDGQCKLSIVGAGAADGNMRLPPKGYREKIWDHAAGSHYVIEAGGKVTDLQGRSLDFTEGRYLAADVTAILASNGVLHNEILDAIIKAKNE